MGVDDSVDEAFDKGLEKTGAAWKEIVVSKFT